MTLTDHDDNSLITQNEQTESSTEQGSISKKTKKMKKIKQKRAAMERVMGGIVGKFMKQQEQAEARFFSFQEKMYKEESMRENDENDHEYITLTFNAGLTFTSYILQFTSV